jgi:hypothetical protein
MCNKQTAKHYNTTANGEGLKGTPWTLANTGRIERAFSHINGVETY